MARAAATTDADLALLLEKVRERTLVRMTHNAEALAPHLREGVTVERASDVLVAYLTPELVDTLVHGFEWSPHADIAPVHDLTSSCSVP